MKIDELDSAIRTDRQATYINFFFFDSVLKFLIKSLLPIPKCTQAGTSCLRSLLLSSVDKAPASGHSASLQQRMPQNMSTKTQISNALRLLVCLLTSNSISTMLLIAMLLVNKDEVSSYQGTQTDQEAGNRSLTSSHDPYVFFESTFFNASAKLYLAPRSLGLCGAAPFLESTAYGCTQLHIPRLSFQHVCVIRDRCSCNITTISIILTTHIIQCLS